MAKRSTDHIKAQREGRARDLETCQACGSRDNIQGHHILDHQFSGSSSTDNIIALCKICHANVHNGRMDILKF